MARRYFTEDIAENTAVITGEDAAHLAKVLRAKPGDAVTVCDGKGTDYETVVRTASPSEVVLDILSHRAVQAEPSVQAHVFIGYAKGDRMDYAVQKSVELGAVCIHPFYSSNTVVKPGKDDSKKVQRLNRIAAEAAKQSGRGILPQVCLPVSFNEMLKEAIKSDIALFFYELGGIALRQVQNGFGSVALISGAEGGFTPEEAEAAKQAGCQIVGLGPRILRCETAPVAALTAVMLLTENLE